MYRSLDFRNVACFYTCTDRYNCLKHNGLIKILANERWRAYCAPRTAGAAGPDVFGGTSYIFLRVSPVNVKMLRHHPVGSWEGKGKDLSSLMNETLPQPFPRTYNNYINRILIEFLVLINNNVNPPRVYTRDSRTFSAFSSHSRNGRFSPPPPSPSSLLFLPTRAFAKIAGLRVHDVEPLRTVFKSNYKTRDPFLTRLSYYYIHDDV